VKRVLPLLLLLTGCAATPVATTTPSSTTTTTTTTVTTTSPRLDTPRKLPADPCQVLVASDFDAPLFGAPAPQPNIPRSCLFQVGPGTDEDQLVRVRFGDAYVRPDQSMELLIGDGHSASVTCGETPNGIGCTELVAVNATESLEVLVLLPGGNSDQVAKAVQDYTRDAFARMVVTS
jgi:hypothetical protein